MNTALNYTRMPKPLLLEALDDYMEIEECISDIIRSTGYKNNFIAQKLKLPISTFYQKKRTKTFTSKEVIQIVRLLEDEESHYENSALLELAKSRRGGETTSAEEYIKYLSK